MEFSSRLPSLRHLHPAKLVATKLPAQGVMGWCLIQRLVRSGACSSVRLGAGRMEIHFINRKPGKRSDTAEAQSPKDWAVDWVLRFCGWTALGTRSRKTFMMIDPRSFMVVWGVSSITPVLRSNTAKDGYVSAPLTRRNPRLLRRADTAFAFIESHTD